MNNGYGILRHDLMYNDFVLIGPKKDKKTCSSIEKKMIEIKKSKTHCEQPQIWVHEWVSGAERAD